MIKHYFKIAIRNLSKQRVPALINILGLSIGIACFSLFLLYALNEFNYDRFHKNATLIFRVFRWNEAYEGREKGGDTYMPMPLGPAMKQDFPDVNDYVRIDEGWSKNFVRTGKTLNRIPVSFADPQVLTVFSFPMKYGNPAQALKSKHDVVLTDETSKKLFGDVNPVGREIEIKVEDKFETFTVNGVCEDLPSNSSIQFEILASYEFLETTTSGQRSMNNWNRSSYQTYVLLQQESKLAEQPNRMLAFHNKYYPDNEKELRKSGRWKGKGAPETYGLQPITDMHTNTEIVGGLTEQVNPKNLWILLSIAAGVLIIACINFTTLSIGRSAGRAKEVGIRKVVGSNKKSLIAQFLTEAILLSILSLMIGLLMAQILLPYFNQLSGRNISFSLKQFPELAWLLAALMVIVGIVAGSYPSLVLSAFKPVEVLKSKLRLNGSNFFTKSLVTFQFVLSISLIISTVIIMQQLKFMQSRNPGFTKENVIVVDASEINTKKNYPVFRQLLLAHPEIKSMAGAELGLGEGMGWSRSGFEFNRKPKEVYEYSIDADYLNVLNIPLLAGRNFDPGFSDDTVKSVIINESMMRDFGWTLKEAVGKQLTGYSENFTPIVIGVAKNFHYRPFKEEVSPQMFQQFSNYKRCRFFVRIQPGDPSKALASIEKEWKVIVPDLPLNYSFLDEDLDKFYKSESKWANIVGWAGGISIFLACLGLFGLASLAAINRTKEIGIRKILGASITAIVKLLSKDFTKLIIIALLIASPITWYLMHGWLQDFAYRINISYWIFILSGIVTIFIAIATISMQAIKAALANPVKNIRTE